MTIIDTIRQEEPDEAKPHTATYSPEDDKIRIYPLYRLPKDEYSRLKSAGFMWAPKQECFYAVWTPYREETALDFADEIEDEDKTLVDRAEERAERFETYSEHRAQDADRAHSAVAAICDNIPFGQPILVGHHSEKHARRDQKRIEQGMTRAVKMWDTAKYWTSRAAGAIRHAKYKERPDVRARRIKGLEADKRKQERNRAEAEKHLALWTNPALTLDLARLMTGRSQAGYLPCEKHPHFSHFRTAYDVLQPEEDQGQDCKAWTLEQVQRTARRILPANIKHADKWINHLDNRLLYEKAMLDEAGASDLLKPAPRPEQLPLCNYRAPEGFIMVPNIYHRGQLEKYRQVDMTKAEYTKINTDYKGTNVVENSHRVRITILHSPSYERVTVFLTDSKTHLKPEPIEKKEINPDLIRRAIAPTYQEKKPDPQAAKFDAMKESLKTGVQTVSAPQLFPTPPDIAARMVEHLDVEPGMSIADPSAGTGNLLKALPNVRPYGCITAIEINSELCKLLEPLADVVYNEDFLQFTGAEFDRIIMNPPFENGADINHIRHAFTMLKPGGRLVALCANGPRQQAAFRETADHWGPLPAKSFSAQGTNVNVALLVLVKPAEKTEPDPEPEGSKDDPEARLREMWTAKGVPQERQDEIIRDTTAKAQPGAYVGPFRIPAHHNQQPHTQMLLF